MTRREGAQVFGLWLVLATLRWLAALPVRQPRIFRDELLHWQLAQSFVTHRPFLVSGEVVDYPAVLYPALLSLGLHTRDTHLAFQFAHGLNALMVSAVVFFAYALARELSDHRDALAVAALAGLAPGGGYSVFIMEENLYYPLFVASCWLCWRVLVNGRARDAAWCALALGLTYFAKPLAVPLVAAYAGVVLLWAAAELRSTEPVRRRLAALAVRLAPVVAFGAMLLVRHALTTRGVDETRAGAVLGRFYTDELGGALLPPAQADDRGDALAVDRARVRRRDRAGGGAARRMAGTACRPAAALARRADDLRGGGIRARRGAPHDGDQSRSRRSTNATSSPSVRCSSRSFSRRAVRRPAPRRSPWRAWRSRPRSQDSRTQCCRATRGSTLPA